MRLGLIFALCLSATTAFAADGQWFQHQFGERRAYFGDWLAACDDQGDGPCRLVQIAVHDGSNAFFDQRIALVRHEERAGWVVEVMDRNLPADVVETVAFDIDGKTLTAPAGALKAGTFGIPNVSDTITVIDMEFTEKLVAAMRAGNRLEVTYSPSGEGRGAIDVPLRGVTAGTRAIEAEAAKR